MLDEGCARLIISNPASKQQEYKKITAEKKKTGYQISKYTEFTVAIYTLPCYTILRRTNRERYHGGTYYGIQNWLCN